MKKILIILVSLLLIIAIIFGLLIYNSKSIIEYAKPYLEKTLSDISQRKVVLGDLSLNIFPTPKLEAKNIQIEGAQSLSVESISFKANIGALLQKRFELSEVEVGGANFAIPNSAFPAFKNIYLKTKLVLLGTNATFSDFNVNGLIDKISSFTLSIPELNFDLKTTTIKNTPFVIKLGESALDGTLHAIASIPSAEIKMKGKDFTVPNLYGLNGKISPDVLIQVKSKSDISLTGNSTFNAASFTKDGILMLKSESGNTSFDFVLPFSGNFIIDANNSELIGLNFAKSVLDKIQIITPVFPEQYQGALNSSSTIIKKFSAKGDISTKLLLTSPTFTALSDLFSVNGSGAIDLPSKNLDLKTIFTFPAPLAAAFVDKAKELQTILDDDGSLSFPLQISGVPPKVLILPDFDKLLAKAAKGVVREKAKELINDAIQKKGGGLLRGLGF